MPKAKTHSGAKKRFKLTGSGKLKRRSAYKSHILTKKSKKRKRHLNQASVVRDCDLPRLRKMLNI